MTALKNNKEEVDYDKIKKEESDKLVKNCRKPEGDLGEKMIKRMNKSHEKLAHWGVSHLNICPDDIILDIGCGGGVNVKRFSSMSKNKIYGLDYSKKSVEESIKYNSEGIETGQVGILEGSVSNIPFEDESIDIVTGFETIYFWPDLKEDLKEIKRVLKRDGAIFICNEEVNDGHIEERLGERMKLLDMYVPSEDELGQMLADTGFKDVTTFTKANTKWVCAIGRKE